MRYFIKTFGCQQNVSDSERIAKAFKNKGILKANSYEQANYVVINTCIVRQSAENRVYGLVNNLSKLKEKKGENKELFEIIVTGCMVGLAFKDRTGKYLKKIKKAMPKVDKFVPIEEISFDTPPLREDKKSALVPISNGCNNFCTYCVVPMARGKETSVPYKDIIKECKRLYKQGYENITLLGQNVNSYGADILKSKKEKKDLKPVYVKHLGRLRIPTLFPHLLNEVAKLGFKKVDFISSNPWDFSNELIDVIEKNKNITRIIHLPVQSGDDNVLKRMNRWYTKKEYLDLIKKLKKKIKTIKITTDIIVGFCGETNQEFQNTVDLCKKANFKKAYISIYSERPYTAAEKILKDDISHKVKKKRWKILESMINKL